MVLLAKFKPNFEWKCVISSPDIGPLSLALVSAHPEGLLAVSRLSRSSSIEH